MYLISRKYKKKSWHSEVSSTRTDTCFAPKKLHWNYTKYVINNISLQLIHFYYVFLSEIPVPVYYSIMHVPWKEWTSIYLALLHYASVYIVNSVRQDARMNSVHAINSTCVFSQSNASLLIYDTYKPSEKSDYSKLDWNWKSKKTIWWFLAFLSTVLPIHSFFHLLGFLEMRLSSI